MTDDLHDHLREHCRGHYERVEARFVTGRTRSAAVNWEAVAALLRRPGQTPEDLEQYYQDWLAERHGKRLSLPDSLPDSLPEVDGRVF